MSNSIKLPISMSVDQVIDLMRKANGQITFTINLVNDSGDVSTENDFENVINQDQNLEVQSLSEAPERQSKFSPKKSYFFKKVKRRRKSPKMDRSLKFRRDKLKISPIVGRGSRQAMWLCPLDNFPENALASEAKDALKACGLVTIRHVTALKEGDIQHKLDKLGIYNQETRVWVVEQIKYALKQAGLSLFHPYGPYPKVQEELDL